MASQGAAATRMRRRMRIPSHTGTHTNPERMRMRMDVHRFASHRIQAHIPRCTRALRGTAPGRRRGWLWFRDRRRSLHTRGADAPLQLAGATVRKGGRCGQGARSQTRTSGAPAGCTGSATPGRSCGGRGPRPTGYAPECHGRPLRMTRLTAVILQRPRPVAVGIPSSANSAAIAA